MSFKISKLRIKRTRASSSSSVGNRKKNRIPPSIFLIGIGIWALVVLFLYGGRTLHYTDLLPGQRAPETLAASIKFECVDFPTTELKRNQAKETVFPVFSINYEKLNDAKHDANKLIDQLVSDSENLESTLEIMEINLKPDLILKLFPSGQVENIRSAILQGLEDIWSQGIVSSKENPDFFNLVKGAQKITLYDQKTGDQKEIAIREVSDIDTAAVHIGNKVCSKVEEVKTQKAHFAQLIKFWLFQNLFYESDLTEEARSIAMESVEPVLLTVHSGDTLMEAGQIITDPLLAKLAAHHEALINAQSRSETIRMLLVQAGLLLAALFIFGGILFILQPALLQQYCPVLVMGILCIFTLLSIKGLIYLSSIYILPFSTITLLAPIAIAPLIATILYGGSYALAVGIWTSLAVATTMDNSFMILVQGLIVTVTAVLSARDVHKRSKIFTAGVFIGTAQALFAISITVLNQQNAEVIGMYAGIAFFAGLLIAFLALLLIPLFEFVFNLTTDIRLLELSDLGHPLLQRMALEAPGTYHHSLMVANLAQAAAQEIEANDLLVRVCAYFHDIGKLSKPEFFIENIQLADNPHDEISPSMSALILVSHVKEGVSLAARYKLPPLVVNAIQQHHGTSLISYFFNRAVEQNDEQPPAEEDYRYPGPKPTSPEMGLLLLADSIEAASRSMEKVSSSNIEALVSSMINDRLLDEQLDHCGLTTSQLAIIRKSFIFNLNNMLHGRIAYPTNEDRDKQPTTSTHTKSAENTSTQLVADASGAEA